jgi:hypothetical protein
MAKSSTNHHKPPQKLTFRALSIEQRNAIDLLLTGATDAEVAEAITRDRTTVWQWRHEHPLFRAELERARAEVWRAPTERLRSLIAKAVANVAQAVEGGDVKMSVELLKIVGLYGDGSMHAICEQDPDKLLDELVEQRLAQEKIPDQADHLIDLLKNPRKEERRQEIQAELLREYAGEE